MKKRLIFIIIFILIVFSILFYISLNIKNSSNYHKEICVATMEYYYSYGTDSAFDYIISIYYNGKNYKYEIVEKRTTIAGVEENSKKINGSLSNKKDLIRLDKEYKDKKNNYLESYNYKYVLKENKKDVEFDKIDNFADKVFDIKK